MKPNRQADIMKFGANPLLGLTSMKLELRFVCPVTQKAQGTGMGIDDAESLALNWNRLVTIHCACGRIHEAWVRDLYCLQVLAPRIS
jgi:hypothetical protein